VPRSATRAERELVLGLIGNVSTWLGTYLPGRETGLDSDLSFRAEEWSVSEQAAGQLRGTNCCSEQHLDGLGVKVAFNTIEGWARGNEGASRN
jgi:hypothetical protein